MENPYVRIVYRPKKACDTEEEITYVSNISPPREQGLVDLAISSLVAQDVTIRPMQGLRMQSVYVVHVTQYALLDGEATVVIESEGLTTSETRCVLLKTLDKLRTYRPNPAKHAHDLENVEAWRCE